jgi:hypothetical protein
MRAGSSRSCTQPSGGRRASTTSRRSPLSPRHSSASAGPPRSSGRETARRRDGETARRRDDHLDPHVIEKSADTDEQHEWCWSFFDVRGKVARSLGIHVAHQDVDGTPRITSSGEAVARLVAHEVDHLHGVLYVDRMPPGACTVRVGDYRGTGARSQC